MAISTGATDHREPGAGAGGGSGSGADPGATVEAEMTPAFADSIQYEPGSDSPPQTEISEIARSQKAVIPPPLEPEVITEAPVQAVAAQLGDVAVDVVKLLDLQLRLFESELAASAKQLVQPLVQLVASAVLGAASVIVLLFAASAGLQQLFNLSAALSLLIVAIAGFVITAIAVQIAKKQLMTPRISFAKSKLELMRNAETLAQLLKPPR